LGLAALLASSAANAQGHGDAKKEAAERADAAPDAAGGDASAPATPATPATPERLKDPAERRRSEVARVRARWGALVKSEPARVELETHALRVAKLDAMDRVARAAGKTALLPRIERVRATEETRHERRMKAILDGTKDGGGS
jgi:hypothetical protein